MTETRPVLITGKFPGTAKDAYVSQHCLNGRHEGVDLPKGWRACGMMACDCSCHTLCRDLQPGERWIPETEYVMSEETAAIARCLAEIRAETQTRRAAQAPDAGELDSSGTRRAKGALEAQVLNICVQYAERDLVVQDGFLNCRAISDEIEKQYGGSAPSLGAIQFVLDKWEDLEFCYVRRKPLAFLAFSGEYTAEALAILKAKK